MSVAGTVERLGGIASYGAVARLTSKRAVKRALEAGAVVRDSRGRLALPRSTFRHVSRRRGA